MVDLGYSMKEIGFLCGVVGVVVLCGLSGGTLCASLGGINAYEWSLLSSLCFSPNNILCIAVLIPSNDLAVNACHCRALPSYGMGTWSILRHRHMCVQEGRNRLHSANRYHTSHGDSSPLALIANSMSYTGACFTPTQGAIALASFFYTMYMNERSKDNRRNTIQEI